MMTLSQTAGLVAAWAGTSAIVGAVLLLLALAAQPLARKALPSRLVWATSLALTLLVTIGLPLRQADNAPASGSTTNLSLVERPDEEASPNSLHCPDRGQSSRDRPRARKRQWASMIIRMSRVRYGGELIASRGLIVVNA